MNIYLKCLVNRINIVTLRQLNHTWPPEKAYLLIFFLISFGVSVKKIDVVASEADIFVLEPWRAGKKTLLLNLKSSQDTTTNLCSKAGFLNPLAPLGSPGGLSLGATSLVIRK